MTLNAHVHTCPQCGVSEVKPGLKCGCTHAVKGEGLKVMEELWISGDKLLKKLRGVA